MIQGGTTSCLKHSLIPQAEYNLSGLVLCSYCSFMFCMLPLCIHVYIPCWVCKFSEQCCLFFYLVSPTAPWQYPAFRILSLIFEQQWVLSSIPANRGVLYDSLFTSFSSPVYWTPSAQSSSGRCLFSGPDSLPLLPLPLSPSACVDHVMWLPSRNFAVAPNTDL